MTSSIKTIFLRENEKDIFKALQDQNIEIKILQKYLSKLFNRVYNNYVGYYIFRQNNILYRLIILPKTIDKSSPTVEKDFINYLLHYYRINNKYRFDKVKKIEDSILNLAFEDNNQNNSHLPLEEFEFYKYQSILQEIYKFFKKHKNYKKIKVDYASQNIKYRLNLQKNIKELDKTKLHQIKYIDMIYSLIATISYRILKLFINNRLNDFDDKKKRVLLGQCRAIYDFIATKYNLDKSYKLNISKLNSLKIQKDFKATNETKRLLINLKSLFGFEQMYEDRDISVNNRYDLSTTSLFINPNNFYEWYVYDVLKRYAIKKNKIIIFDKQEGTKTEYFLNQMKKSSNPDYILIDEEKKIKIVIDAKWKNINDFGDIKSSDYMKLKFDVSLLENNEYKVCSLLVYPRVNIKDRSFDMIFDNKSIFNFNILEITL